jgi:hypothetical protein
MKFELNKNPGRPKKLPDIMPQLEAAIKEWEESDEAKQIAVDMAVEHRFVEGDAIWFGIKVGILMLIYTVIIYLLSRIRL